MLRTHTKSLVLAVAAAAALVAGGSGSALASTTVGEGVPNPNDQLTFSKAEVPLAVDPGATATGSVRCADGFVALDGSAVILSVDQGGGPLSSVSVTRAVRSTDGTGYDFTVINHATGRTQLKLLVSCLSKQSSAGGKLQELAPVSSSGAIAPGVGHRSAPLACPADSIAIAPSYEITGSTRGYLAGSAPNTDASSWTLDVVSDDLATVKTSVGCLSTVLTSGAHLATIVQTTTIDVVPRPDGASGAPQYSSVLPVGYSGLIAGATAPAGTVPLGHEPQDRTEVFSLAGSGQATLSVVGIAIATQGTGPVKTHRTPLWKLLGMPPSKTCLATPDLHITVPASFLWKGDIFTIRSLTLGVNGFTFPPVTHRRPLETFIDVNGFTGNTLVVTISVKNADGKTLSATRRYHLCATGPATPA